MLKIIALPATDEADVSHVLVNLPFAVPELRECVHNDTEDHVQTDGSDQDEEGHIEEGFT